MLSIKIPAVTSYCINSLLRSRTIGRRSSKLRFPQPSLKTSVRRFSSLSSLTWPVEKVRDQFIDYFVDKHDHVNYKSSPCVPVNDPTLLFANAGMNQFKPIFIGTVDPNSPLSSLKRVVNTQKCIRAGGKHNDLEDVGKDTYHHTFFEMLGTWSFGNYFKKEAIDWAYDLLVNHYKLDPNRLYASYFAGDEGQGLPCDTEARDYWLQYLPPERVLPFDKKANFWEMGDTGPCGPCSEIHYDRIGNRDASALVNADDPNVIEIWNLVFIQFNRENNGQLKALPNKHIDTGMGLERLTSILQNVPSNYDTDVFVPIFDAISREIGCSPYSGKLGKDDASQNYRDTAYRVIADHLRTISFAITDGAYPSNEGRGYVLRRVLRRAVRYGMQTLGGKPGFFSNLIPFVVNHFSKTFPELNNKVNEVVQVVREEELSFAALLEKGIKYFNDVVSEQQRQGKTIIEGETAFFLYDTLGFPIDLTQIMASEKGFSVDLNRFQQLMNEQKERGRKATSLKRLEGRDALVLQPDDIAYLQKTKNIPPTIDQYKYSSDYATPLTAKLEAIYTSKDKFQERFRLTSSSDDTVIGIILDQTNFYAESGGQIADTGKFEIVNGQGERIVLDVLDTQVYGGYVLHSCVPSSDSIFGRELSFSVKDAVLSSVDAERRKKIAPNHSMTHVLNYALRKTLGEGIDQKGSLVSDEKLRFDFSYPKAMTRQDLERVEAIVNDIINKQYTVSNGVIPLSQAKKIAGLRAVFGEVYPDPVRVLSIGAKIDELTSDPSNEKWKDYSIEFCGGIHLTNTADAQRFVIVEETAVAKGIRRITAVTRETARDIEKHSKQLLATSLQLEEELNQLMNSLSQKNVHVNNNLWKFDDDDRRAIQSLDDKLGSLRQETETSSTSVTLLSQIKEKNDVIVKQLFQLKNQELQSTIRSSVQSIAQEITSSQSSNSIAVYVLRDLPIENGKISKLISDEINKIDPNASFVCILPNSTVNKVSVFSSLQPSVLKARSDFSAPKLLQQLIDGVSELASGRCGGKGGFAQGSLQPLSSSSEYEQLVKNVLTKAREIVDSKQ